MKRAAFSVAFLLLVAGSAFAATRTVLVVDDVIRMTKAGVADDTIVAFVKNSADAFEINGDDVLAMNEAHVSPAVLKFVVDESGARMKQMHSQALSASAERGRAPQGDQNNGDDPDVVVHHTYGGPYYYSDPYYYSPYYYGYPYYGYPYWGIGIGFGYTYYGGHYYGHGGYGHGHGGGHYGGGGHGGGGHGGGGHGGGGHGGGGHGGGHGGGGHGGH